MHCLIEMYRDDLSHFACYSFLVLCIYLLQTDAVDFESLIELMQKWIED